jgi:hypothetical protein
MNIREFISLKLQELERFQKSWESTEWKDATMKEGDWDDQFYLFLESENSEPTNNQ